MTERFNRKNYEFLTEEQQKDFFDEKTLILQQRGLKVKDQLIKAMYDGIYIRHNIPKLNCTTGNSYISIIIDTAISNILGGKYVDEIGYDILYKEHGAIVRISSKSLKKMFAKTGTRSIIDSNKLASSDNYDNNKHDERTDSDVYLLVQTEGQLLIAVAPKAVYDVYHKETSSNTSFTIPNDSYIKFIISREDNIYYDENYVSDNIHVLNLINATNEFFNKYGKEDGVLAERLNATDC